MSPEELLMLALSAAVPLNIAQISALPVELRQAQAKQWALRAGGAVAARGDQLLRRTPPDAGKGDTAATFNDLARGLAALALQPGGVTFAGTHWCSTHAGGCSAAGGLACAPVKGTRRDPR